MVEQGGNNPLPIALSGRVPVKISDENGPITAGDYLVASTTKPGYAAKAVEYGRTVGVAMGSHASGDGIVLVSVESGTYNPTAATALTSQVNSLQMQFQGLGSSVNTGSLNAVSLTVTGNASITGGLTFANPFGSAPRIVLTPVGKQSAALLPYVDSPTAQGFSLGVSIGLQTGKTYSFNYHVLQ